MDATFTHDHVHVHVHVHLQFITGCTSNWKNIGYGRDQTLQFKLTNLRFLKLVSLISVSTLCLHNRYTRKCKASVTINEQLQRQLAQCQQHFKHIIFTRRNFDHTGFECMTHSVVADSTTFKYDITRTINVIANATQHKVFVFVFMSNFLQFVLQFGRT